MLPIDLLPISLRTTPHKVNGRALLSTFEYFALKPDRKADLQDRLAISICSLHLPWAGNAIGHLSNSQCESKNGLALPEKRALQSVDLWLQAFHK